MALGFNTGTLQVLPDRNLQKKTKPRVLKASFGDGYEQRIVDGINNIVENFSISIVNRSRQDIDNIAAFFDSLAGVQNFEFTYPDTSAVGGEKTIQVVCDDYSVSFVNNSASSINATFRQVFEP